MSDFRVSVRLPTAWALVAGLAACPGTDPKADPSAAEEARAAPAGPQRIPDDTFDMSAFERKELDLNKDGVPDAYQFLKTVDEDVIVVRKEVDVNFDAKVDLVREFNDRGDLVSERLDTDFDGRIDVVNFFEEGLIARKEYDTNFDNVVDLWRYFDKGVIARKEADLNHDGNVDYWEYYENGQIDRVGIDRDSDGVVDDWETAGAGAG